MAVDVGKLRNLLVEARRLYDIMDQRNNWGSDREYDQAYKKLETAAKRAEQAIDRAWAQNSSEFQRLTKQALGSVQKGRKAERGIGARIQVLADKSNLISLYMDEISQLDYEYHAPGGRRFS